jgi:hypothetical protein
MPVARKFPRLLLLKSVSGCSRLHGILLTTLFCRFLCSLQERPLPCEIARSDTFACGYNYFS